LQVVISVIYDLSNSNEGSLADDSSQSFSEYDFCLI
jgi:hypothetical protein